MLPKEDIQNYGGKAAILNYVKTNLPDMPIPPYLVKPSGQDYNSILKEFNILKKPVIIRSSSPHEYADFEGIFDSERDVHNENSLRWAIERVEKSANSERAEEYAKQHNLEISDKIHTIIQEQSDSQYCGAMMRHPNNPDLVFINYFEGRGKFQQKYHHFIFDERTQSSGDIIRCMCTGIPEENAKFLIDKYKEIESLTAIAEGYSLFVEFGFNPFALYQVRPFKKIETADFELPKFDHNSALWTDVCFGITQQDGIILPVIRGMGITEAVIITEELGQFKEPTIPFSDGDMDLMMDLSNVGMAWAYGAFGSGRNEIEFRNSVSKTLEIYNKNVDRRIDKPYCFMTSSAQREEYDLDLILTKMEGLIFGRSENFLTHNLIRLLKKADVTVAQSILIFDEFYKNTKSLEDKVRIISNGKEGIVLKE